MTTQTSFRSSWAEMSKPPSLDALTVKPVRGTNAFLTKDYYGSLGLFLKEVHDDPPKRNYKHIDIVIHAKKILHIPGKGKQTLDNCLILSSDPRISTAALTLILEGLYDKSPEGAFSSTDLITVLDEIEELLKRPKAPPSKEEVAGAWGELHILKMLIQSATTSDVQRKILLGWEGEVREKLDFRFAHTLIGLEVKTTMSERRIHHLHGVEQVTIPDGYTNGILASLLVDTSDGFTCINQIEQIERAAKGTESEQEKFMELLSHRTLIRGQACLDDRFRFQLRLNGLKFYDFGEVPKSPATEGVTPIEWLSDFSDSKPLNLTSVDALMLRITHPQ